MESLKLRVKRVERFGDLHLQLIKSVYVHDERTSVELHMDGCAVIHIHGFIDGTPFCAKTCRDLDNVFGRVFGDC